MWLGKGNLDEGGKTLLPSSKQNKVQGPLCVGIKASSDANCRAANRTRKKADEAKPLRMGVLGTGKWGKLQTRERPLRKTRGPWHGIDQTA